MQSISFEYGSQQSMHQDTAYVVSERPLCLAATWIALEDIEEGSGELMYYPGSHRFGHFLFSGLYKSWKRGRDGDAAHAMFLEQLHTQARERGIREQRFMARKGDVLVWHADLAHGGSPIRLEGRTRRSLVTHFCPRSVKPFYRRLIPLQYCEFEPEAHCCFTSRHYDLNRMTGGSAPVFYDGGVSKRRVQAQHSPSPPSA
jgi:ectoine hydroxylase-related dioxygenase (phytanoyl-CoA dioxygenase family)